MDFDEDDFIFIESDAPVENVTPVTAFKTGRSKYQPALAKRSSAVDAAEPSTSKPKLKRSFRTSPELSGEPTSRGKKKKKDADPDSEEERWLDALEEGNLEQVDDELKKMRNPLLMTARQRALLEKRSGEDSLESFPAEPLVALPSGYREKATEMTAEMVERHKQKTQRRREQAKKHREEEKKKTVSRLLSKSEKTGRGALRLRAPAGAPAITYTQTVEGSVLRLSPGLPSPLVAQSPREPPKVRLCGGPHCQNLRRYTCSRTGVPLCSLECYKTNLARTPPATGV